MGHKCKVALENLDAARAEADKKKQAERQADIKCAQDAIKAMDKAEGDNKAAVKARMDQIEKNCATLGAEIAGRDARLEQELQDRITRVQNESDRLAKEDQQRRASSHAKKVGEMLAGLNQQCKEREEGKVADREADRKQAIKFKEDYEEGLRKDKADLEKVRKARADQDLELIAAIRRSAVVHPKNYLIDHEGQKVDLAYNRVLFEQMVGEGYRTDISNEFVSKARHGGKLDPKPSVGRYDGPIDELEMQV